MRASGQENGRKVHQMELAGVSRLFRFILTSLGILRESSRVFSLCPVRSFSAADPNMLAQCLLRTIDIQG